MGFWVRYSFVILFCVVAPIALGFYMDTRSEVQRSLRAGATTAEASLPALNAQLTLHGHKLVGRSLMAAHAISAEKLLPPAKTAIRPEVAAKLSEIVTREVGRKGFAWVLDESGAILARNPEVPGALDKIGGHPLFVATQRGYGLDGFWTIKDKVYLVGAAPIVKDDEARGAVFIGDPIDQDMVIGLGQQIGAEMSVLLDNQLVASSLPDDVSASILPKLGEGNTSDPVQAGRSVMPLRTAELPFLPLFVEKKADGIAYSSLARQAPGANNVRWVISVENTKYLQPLAERQQNVLAVLAIALLAALVFGMILHRTFVRPIRVLVDHLSELQQGRGERELPESKVAGPFRRLLKLINMTVQRIPTSSFGFNEEVVGRINVPPPQDSADLQIPMVPSIAPGAAGGSGIVGIPAGQTLAGIRPAARPAESNGPAPSSRPSPSAMALEDEAQEERLQQSTKKSSKSASTIRGTPAVNLETPAPPAPVAPPAPAAIPVSMATADLRRMNEESVAAAAPGNGLRGGIPALIHEDGEDPFSSDRFSPAFPPPAATSGPRSGGSAAMSPMGFGEAGTMDDPEAFRSESTVVAAPNYDLIDASRRDAGGAFTFDQDSPQDRTLVAETPEDLLNQSKNDHGGNVEAMEAAHFKETYERFLEMRKQCKESTSDLAFDRFVSKLRKNRDSLIKKYNCKTVRFQVYEKDGKAALKATPVRA